MSDADFDGMSVPWQLVGAFAILLQTLGLATLLKWRNTSTLAMAAQTGLIASIAFAIPTALIPLVYRPEHNVMLFLLDAGIYVIGLTTTAVLLTVLPGSSPKREQVHSFAQSIAAAG